MSTQTATLEITGLREETLKALAMKAKESGQTTEEYTLKLIEKNLSSNPDDKESPAQIDQEERERAADAWMQEWKVLVEKVSAAIPDGPSLVDTLIVMRR
jgi:hypothetical protein